jgi:hypothetical protein
MKPVLRVPTELRVKHPSSGRARIPFLQRCKVTAPGGLEQSGLICDLSTAGIYVRMDPLPEWHSVVHVTFDLLPGDPFPMQLDAEVAWLNDPAEPRVPELPPGVGLRFVDSSPEATARIASLVKASITGPTLFPSE